MYRIELDQHIRQIQTLLYRIGIWNLKDEETKRKFKIKWFFSTINITFALSLFLGALISEALDTQIFLFEESIITSVLQLKMWYLVWHRDELIDHLERNSGHCVDDQKTITNITNKRNILKKISGAFCGSACSGVGMAIVISFLERKLTLEFAFPLDYKNDDSVFWITFIYFTIVATVGVLCISFTIIIWYVMAALGWRYMLLGKQIEKMGAEEAVQLSDAERNHLFQQDFVDVIKTWNLLKEYFDDRV